MLASRLMRADKAKLNFYLVNSYLKEMCEQRIFFLIAYCTKIKQVICNLRQNISRLFHFVAQFLFTTTETELDCYHQRVNVRVAEQFAERFLAKSCKKISCKTVHSKTYFT